MNILEKAENLVSRMISILDDIRGHLDIIKPLENKLEEVLKDPVWEEMEGTYEALKGKIGQRFSEDVVKNNSMSMPPLITGNVSDTLEEYQLYDGLALTLGLKEKAEKLLAER